MSYAIKITFSDSSTIFIDDSTPIAGIRSVAREQRAHTRHENTDLFLYPKSAAHSGHNQLNLEAHPTAGLIPPVVDLLTNYEYFSIDENDSIMYSSAAVVKFEQIIR